MLVGVSTEVISHSVTLLCCVGLYLHAGVHRACTEEGKGLGGKVRSFRQAGAYVAPEVSGLSAGLAKLFSCLSQGAAE